MVKAEGIAKPEKELERKESEQYEIERIRMEKGKPKAFISEKGH